jgi:hypothetical protein
MLSASILTNQKQIYIYSQFNQNMYMHVETKEDITMKISTVRT